MTKHGTSRPFRSQIFSFVYSQSSIRFCAVGFSIWGRRDWFHQIKLGAYSAGRRDRRGKPLLTPRGAFSHKAWFSFGGEKVKRPCHSTIVVLTGGKFLRLDCRGPEGPANGMVRRSS